MADEKAKKRAARKAERKARRKHRLGDWPPELQAVATYEFGQSREALAALKARVTRSLQDPGGVCVLLLGNWRVMTPLTP